MAIHVYRFRAQGPNTTDITQEVPGTVTFSAAGFVYVDYSADSTNLQDLTDALAIRGWVYDSTDPTLTPAQQAAANGSDAINILLSGTLVAKQPSINFVSGATVVNNSGANRIDITIPAGTALGSATPTALTAAAGSAGVATNASREDHTHQVTTTAPVDLGTANAAGSSTSLARADHVHNVPFAPVNAALAQANASISVNSQKIVSLADPTAPQDAATKAYVDATKQGLDPKDSARVTSIAPLPANTAAGSGPTKTLTSNSNSTLTVDGVLLALNDRVLVANEASGVNNGLYFVSQAGSGALPWILTRATDANTTAKVTPGMYVFVEEGSSAGNGYVLTTVAPITLDTTALSYTQFSGAGQITAGAGLTKSGNTLNVVAADGSITVAADSIAVGVISDTQHGNLSGGALHQNVVAAGASGFMTGADKTKLDNLPAVPATAVLEWGNFNIGTSTTPRFLSPGYESGAAAVVAHQYRAPRAGTIKNMRAHASTAGVGGGTLTFTMRKNSATQALTCNYAVTAVDGSDTTNSFAVAAGDLLDLTVTKSGSITTSPVDTMVTVEYAP